MRVIYCPPGTDPMTVARAHRRARGGPTGLLQYWWVAGVVAFGLFTAYRQLPPPETATPPATPTSTAVAAPDISRVAVAHNDGAYCQSPLGGVFPPGDTIYLPTDTEDTITQWRCHDGELVAVTP